MTTRRIHDTDDRWDIEIYDKSNSLPEAFYPYIDGDKVTVILCSLDWKTVAITWDAHIEKNTETGEMTLKLPSAYRNMVFSQAIIGFPINARLQLFQQLLPNNSGIVFKSKHSVARIDLQLFKSAGGSIWYNGKKVGDLLQFMYGKDVYNASQIDPATGKLYAFTGSYGVDNPSDLTDKDELEIISDEPEPFNLMAIGLLYNVTEVN